MRLIAILFILATLTSSSQAQDLSKEITVEKEIVPQHINVSRINLTPEVALKPITNHNLPYSNQSIATPPQTLIATLEPAQHRPHHRSHGSAHRNHGSLAGADLHR